MSNNTGPGMSPSEYEYEPRRKHGHYSRWCVVFSSHLARLNLNFAAFSMLVGRSEQMVQAYACGRARPPIREMEQWADALRLTGHARDGFILAAHEAHTLPVVWARLVQLEAAALARDARSESAKRLRDAEAAIAALVRIAQEAETIFYRQDVPFHQIRDRRARLGGQLRKAIERYASAPADPRVAEAVNAAAACEPTSHTITRKVNTERTASHD